MYGYNQTHSVLMTRQLSFSVTQHAQRVLEKKTSPTPEACSLLASTVITKIRGGVLEDKLTYFNRYASEENLSTWCW